MDKFGFVGETTEYKLSDLFNLQMCKTPSRNNAEFWSDGEYKWISIADLTKTGKYISETKELLSQKAIDESGIAVIPTNTVVMSFKLSIGKTAITSEDMYSNEAIMSFHDRHVTELLPEYIYYLLLAQRWDEGANKAVMGMTQNKATLSNRKVRIHSIIAQKSIVERLDKLQKLIDDRKTQLDELETLIKARFVEMFGDPLAGTEKWSFQTVGDVADSVDPQPSHRTPPVVEGGIPYVSMKDCNYKNGTIDFAGARKVSPDVLVEHHNRYELHNGDFIIGKIGTIGNPIFVPKRDDYALSANVVLIQPNSSKVSPYFLKETFESSFVERQFLDAKNSTSQAAFGIKKVRNIKIMNPDMKTQMEFENFAIQVDKLKVEVQSIFLNCDSRSIFRYAQSIKGCKIEKYERRCSFDTKRECHRGNEKKWWICYLSAIKSDC